MKQRGNKAIISFRFDMRHIDLWHFDMVSAYFSDASQNFLMHKISLVSFWIGRLMYKERINRQIPTTKQETLPKGVGVAKVDFTKKFRNQLYPYVWVLYHQYSITNHSESILKSKIVSSLMIIFVVVFSIWFVKKYFEVQL